MGHVFFYVVYYIINISVFKRNHMPQLKSFSKSAGYVEYAVKFVCAGLPDPQNRFAAM